MTAGTFWTLQQFTQVAGRPWYALHRQNDGGVLQSFTGYRHELAALCDRHGIEPEELEPITESEYLRRAIGEYPDNSDAMPENSLAR